MKLQIVLGLTIIFFVVRRQAAHHWPNDY